MSIDFNIKLGSPELNAPLEAANKELNEKIHNLHLSQAMATSTVGRKTDWSQYQGPIRD